MRKRPWLACGAALAAVASAGGIAAAAIRTGWTWNVPDPVRFPVWGVDVSHHQGSIDWSAVASEQRIRFAYVKATEGAAFTDHEFERNWREARGAGLRVGAYHFFSFCSSGADQARHFLSVVPTDPGALPPALDVEDGVGCPERPGRAALLREISSWCRMVETALGKRPVVYVTRESYRTLIAGSGIENRLWVRDLVREPRPPRGEDWAFWQFHARGRIRGIGRSVDLDAYRSELGPFEEL
jgi:lysozyme